MHAQQQSRLVPQDIRLCEGFAHARMGNPTLRPEIFLAGRDIQGGVSKNLLDQLERAAQAAAQTVNQ